MRNRKFINLGLTFLLSLLLIIVGTNTFIYANEVSQQPASLFTPVQGGTRGSLPNLPSDSKVVRQRLVQANFGLLTRSRGNTLRLNLFDDVELNVVIDQTKEGQTRGQSSTQFGQIQGLSRGGKFSVRQTQTKPATVQFGRIQGMPTSEVYLSSQGNTLSGTVRLPDGKIYEIAPVKSGVHVIKEINPKALPADHPPGAFKKLQQGSTRGERKPGTRQAFDAVRDTSGLKVLVLYTPNVKEAAGGDEGMQAVVSLIQKQTNQGNLQSGVKLRMQIAGAYQVDYQETGNIEQDLQTLTEFSDQNNIRQKLGVDAVSLWVMNTENGVCGYGNLNTSAQDFQEHAYSVVNAKCAVSNFSFAHELGHNLGSCHDEDTDPSCKGVFPYSYGYRDPKGDFRTIMAYQCEVGNGCPRINAWSSPKLAFKNKSLGSRSADNVTSLNSL